MSRILLADHSPHAQRMGERILRDEGFEVATVTDGETALLRLKDLAPDLILADISLPSRNGYEVCEYVKTSGKYPQTRVILTAGPVTAYDEARAQSAGSDGFVRKPFEASILLGTLQPLVEKPEVNAPSETQPAPMPASPMASKPAVTAAPTAPRPIDREQVRAAVILALEASMITIIENITDKVVVALEPETRPAAPVAAKPAPPPPKPAPAELKTVSAAAPKPAAPVTPPAPAAEIKAEPASAAVAEPVVRIRTPLFRSIT